MSLIYIPPTAEEKEKYEAEAEALTQVLLACGRCTTCQADLKTNIDRGILLCAWSHRKQYEDYLARLAEPADAPASKPGEP